MSTMFCSKCGASLAAGAGFCPSCGQAVAAASRPAPSAPASASAGGKRAPLVALAVLGGGLVVLLGALTLYRSGFLSGTGGTTTPVTVTPAAQSTPLSSPFTPGASASPATSASSVPGTPVPAGALPATGAPVGLTPAGKAAPAPPPPPPFSKTYLCQEYAIFNVSPDDAHVWVDGVDIGDATKWDDGRGSDKYEFKSEGVHYVRLTHEDYKTVWLKFIVSSTAADKAVNVEIEMEEK